MEETPPWWPHQRRYENSGREQHAHLLEQTSAISGIHGDELDGHSLPFQDATNDGSGAHLTNGEIQENLDEAAQRHPLFGTNKETTDTNAVDERNAALRARLPGGNNAGWRLSARIAPSLGSVH